MKCRYLHPAASGYLYTSIDRTGNCLNLILLQLTDGYCFLIYIVSMRIIADQVAYCININLFKKLLRLLRFLLNLRCLSFLSYPSYFSYLITTISHCKITSGSCTENRTHTPKALSLPVYKFGSIHICSNYKTEQILFIYNSAPCLLYSKNIIIDRLSAKLNIHIYIRIQFCDLFCKFLSIFF